jgi:hypothetical protein
MEIFICVLLLPARHCVYGGLSRNDWISAVQNLLRSILGLLSRVRTANNVLSCELARYSSEQSLMIFSINVRHAGSLCPDETVPIKKL